MRQSKPPGINMSSQWSEATLSWQCGKAMVVLASLGDGEIPATYAKVTMKDSNTVHWIVVVCTAGCNMLRCNPGERNGNRYTFKSKRLFLLIKNIEAYHWRKENLLVVNMKAWQSQLVHMDCQRLNLQVKRAWTTVFVQDRWISGETRCGCTYTQVWFWQYPWPEHSHGHPSPR